MSIKEILVPIPSGSEHLVPMEGGARSIPRFPVGGGYVKGLSISIMIFAGTSHGGSSVPRELPHSAIDCIAL
jgi:hypothetical protein